MNAQNPAEDTDELELSTDQVNDRVEDWLERLDRLFTEIKTWATSKGWSTKDGACVPMLEDLMKRHGLPAREQPSFSVCNRDGAEIWVKPKGLWVIGANGRIDLYSRRGAFTLIDIANPFEPPHWVIHRVGEREGRPFRPELLEDMV